MGLAGEMVTARDPLLPENSDPFDKRLFFFFFFRRGMSWRSFLFKSPSHVRSVLFPSALQGHKFSSLVSAPAL